MIMVRWLRQAAGRLWMLLQAARDGFTSSRAVILVDIIFDAVCGGADGLCTCRLNECCNGEANRVWFVLRPKEDNFTWAEQR